MDKKQQIAILILAAGESSRMGEKVKQLLPWKSTTMLGHALDQAKATIADQAYVVLGAFEENIKAAVTIDGNSIIQNLDWSKGIGSSIAAGIKHIQGKQRYDAILIMLCDQPLIDTNYLNKMIGNWKGNPNKIITTRYEKENGVPALFGKEHFEALAMLKDDKGAKTIIDAQSGAILGLNPDGKEIDTDNWEGYQKLLEKESKK